MAKEPSAQDTRTIELIDKMINRSRSWILDATERADWNDVSYYEGQRKVLVELKETLLGTWTHGPSKEYTDGTK